MDNEKLYLITRSKRSIFGKQRERFWRLSWSLFSMNHDSGREWLR